LSLSAYRSARDCARQLATNAQVERADARWARPLSIGTADAVLLDEPGQSVLLVASGSSGLGLSLTQGVVAPALTRAVLVDMARRVLPDLVAPR